MQHLMIDLETLGNTHDAAILSVGFCFFSKEQVLITENFILDVTTQLLEKRRVNFKTLCWWLDQDDDALDLFSAANQSKINSNNVLDFLIKFDLSAWRNCKVWSNGIDFDIPMLNNYLEIDNEINPIWKFRSQRDWRTFYQTYKDLVDMPRGKILHDSGKDAEWQARWLMELAKLKPEVLQ